MAVESKSLPAARRALTDAERLYVASQWQLMWRKFRDHKLALVASMVLGVMYLVAILAPFIAPYDPWMRTDYVYHPPSRIHIVHEGRLRMPFVYGIKAEVDRKSWERIYTEDTSKIYPIRFLVRGSQYKFLGLFKTDRHLFGVDNPGQIFLLGTEQMGRDCFSRNVWGAQISLSVGLVGVFVSFVLGCVLGGLSGNYGGILDRVVERAIEFITSIPTIPLWMALSAAVPPTWDQVYVYMGITVILALRGWCGLAREVRGKLLQLREEDFVVAARVAGTGDWAIITTHLLPGFMSVLIVRITLSIPGMILGETALSFLGLGLRPPTVSWGVLLQEAKNLSAVVAHSWLLFPAVLIIITVLAFNFVGDGLRDAADPYVS